MQVQLTKKHKQVLAAIAVFIVAILAILNFAGSKSVDIIKSMAQKQSVLKGTLTLGDVQASWNGNVVFKDIVWLDPKGQKIAELPSVKVSANLSDAFKGNLNANSITDIIVENATINLAYTDKEGLNIQQLIDLQEDKKKDKEKKDPKDFADKFHGNFVVKNSKLNLKVDQKEFAFTNVEINSKFAQYPTIETKLSATQGEAKLEMNLQNSENKIVAAGSLNNFAINELASILPKMGKLSITAGKLSQSKFSTQEENGKLTFNVTGSIDGLAGTALEYPIDSGKGDFEFSNQAAIFKNVSANLAGQKINMAGKINTEKSPSYDLDVNAPAFNVAAISPSLGVNENVAISAKVTGALDNPVITGNFSMAQLSIEPINMSNLNGNFRYNDTKLKINNATAITYGGSVQADGVIDLVKQNFDFDVSGQGLDSAQASGSQVKGPLTFSLNAYGADKDSVVADGNFRIGMGSLIDIPFNSMKGNFHRQNGKMSFSNIVIQTLAGTFSADAFQNPDGKISFSKMKITHDKVDFKDQVNNLRDDLKGKLKKIF